MNKLEYLTRLGNFLRKYGLPEEDINDALTYYEEVFMDAGFGKDAETAETLGSPEELAAGILRDSGIQVGSVNDAPSPNFDQQSEYTNCGAQQNRPYSGQQYNNQNTGKSDSNTILKIIIAILAFPLWFPLLTVVFAVFVAVICLIFALLVAFVAVSISLVFGGFSIIAEIPQLALMLLGGGFAACSISFLICRGLFRIIVPPLVKTFRKFVNWLRGIFVKGEKSYE